MSKKGKGKFIKFHGALPKTEVKAIKETSPENLTSKMTSNTENSTVPSLPETNTTSATVAASSTTTTQPSTTTVKRNPEALLDDLNGSLTSFTSTVKTWLPSAPVSSSSSATATISWHQNGSGREPRLGLGAKPSSSSSEVSSENAGVFASLQLKKKLSSFDSTKKPEKSKTPLKREPAEEEPGRFSSNFKKNKL